MIRLRIAIILLLYAFLTMCGRPAMVQAPALVRESPTTQPTDSPVPPTAAPTLAPTPPPTAPPATPAPALAPVLSPTAVPKPRIGIQVGHWKTETMPEEQIKLRKFSGNYYRGYDEWEVNIVIAEKLRDLLVTAGYDVELLTAVVSPGYKADAFVAIHANGTSTRPEKQHGWSLTAPWRASPAGHALADAVAASYGQVTGLPEDKTGVSFDMLGYYAFAHYRYHHSIDPTTPAILIETGYMTNAADRAIIFERPEIAAQGIADGIVAFIDHADRSETARQPVALPMLKPSRSGMALLKQPSANSKPVVELDGETRLVPMGYRDGWYLAFTRGVWDIGWISEADVTALDEPQTPLTSP